MNRNHIKLIAFAAFVLVSAATARYLHLASRDLLQRSQLLGEAKGWTFSTGHDPYRWLSDTSIFTTLDQGVRQPILYDIRSDTATPLEPLGLLFDADSTRNRIRTWEISADSTHILWCKWYQGAVHTATITGAEHHKWQLTDRGDVISVDYVSWLKDGHEWIANTSGTHGPDQFAFVSDRVNATSVKPKSIPMKQADLLELADPIGYTSSRGLTIQREIVDKSGRRIINASPLIPAGMFDCEIDPSPDRKHLVWHLENIHVSAIDNLIHSIWPAHLAKPRIYCSVWVSKYDGSNMKEVSKTEVDTRYPQGKGPKAFVWMPDGKRVSYICNDRLYAVDVSGYF